MIALKSNLTIKEKKELPVEVILEKYKKAYEKMHKLYMGEWINLTYINSKTHGRLDKSRLIGIY